MDENQRFIPGKAYLFAPIEERSKLIFPEGWDLSEIEKLSGNRKPGRPVIEGQDDNRLYGDIWLLEQIAEKTGIRKDLMKVFGGNREMSDAVMTLAMYLLCGKDTYNQLASWQRIAKTPYAKQLTSPCITLLTQKITEQNRMDLLKLRASRLLFADTIAGDHSLKTYLVSFLMALEGVSPV